MAVDPNTGMPVGPPVPVGSTIGARATLNGMEGVGLTHEQLPLAWDLASTIPGATTTAAWNMGRVGNTIIRGGTASSYGPRTGRGGFIRQGTNQTFNPHHWSRLTRPAMIDPTDSKMYSPFGILSKTGNAVIRAAGRTSFLNEKVMSMTGGDRHPFTRGTFGRLNAMARVGGMDVGQLAGSSISGSLADLSPYSHSQLERNMKWLHGIAPSDKTPLKRWDAMRKTWVDIPSQGGRNWDGKFAKRLTPQQHLIASRAAHMQAIGSSIQGSISGRVVGFYAGAQEARIAKQAGTRIGIDIVSNGPESAFKGGTREAIEAYGQRSTKGMAARLAGSGATRGALRAAPVVGQMLLVADLARMGGKVVARAGRTIVEAGQGLMAPLNKPVMGNMYRDNAVAATSRQRGVMAIANSRLNMRSALGSEAALLHSHFG